TDSWRAGDKPLLFDGNGNKKAAYNSALTAMGGTPAVKAAATAPAKNAASPSSASPSSASSRSAAALPGSFNWSSSGILMSPKPDSTHNIAGLKDPTVVYYNGKYHVFASVASASGYSLVYLNFTDWSQAASAPHHYLDRSGIGTGYRAAPQVFYFAPQRTWYLVYQTGNASFSTNTDISNPNGWSAPRNFYSSMPDIIKQNIGNGYWVDMWVICDSANCYLFSSDDNGHLYRSQTSLAQFPNGFTNTVIAAQDSNKYALFEASNVYKVQGSDQYLLIVEAIGSDGRRYFRSWTTNSLAGSWTQLAASESNPFARASNTTFPAGA
ncbi:non-reducing end alpha-L-arabinofuranosidase family hydrolase, partial [Streptomyces sp. NBS 14/10]|uniref:non-reducing end alpha-L-arabinofuranosidase family hydrolase n=1 Tax=Streptomyces sp. NBS 14/10 TaxID=1945643 RepID=UPI00211B6166